MSCQERQITFIHSFIPFQREWEEPGGMEGALCRFRSTLSSQWGWSRLASFHSTVVRFPSFNLSLPVVFSFLLSSPGVPFPPSVRPVWRRCGRSSWRPTAPQLASSPQRPAPPAPFLAYSSSLPAGSASALPMPSFEPCQCDFRPSFCFHPSISYNKVPNISVHVVVNYDFIFHLFFFFFFTI